MFRTVAVALVSATLFSQTVAMGDSSYVVQQLGLTGSEYQYSTAGGGTTRSSTIGHVLATSAAPIVIGDASRYGSDGAALGTDAWLFDGSASRLIGLTGAGYEYAVAGGGTYRLGGAFMQDGGRVFGYTRRYNAAGANLGVDGWVVDGTTTRRFGLAGAGYEYTLSSAGGGIYRSASVTGIDADGRVCGTTQRYTANGVALGSDAWQDDGTTARVIGLTGDGYEYTYGGGAARNGSVLQQNASGQIVGQSYRYNAAGTFLGYDAWRYSAATGTRLMGLTGAEYEYVQAGSVAGVFRANTVQQNQNAAGQVTGFAVRYNGSTTAMGQDAWIDTASGTRLIGLTGSGYEYVPAGSTGGTARFGYAQSLNAAGQAIGYTARYDVNGMRVGQDAWIYSGGETRLLGLTGSDYEAKVTNAVGGTIRNGYPVQLNAAGAVSGYSLRYNASGKGLGQDVWLYADSKGTRAVGLTGAGYEYAYSGAGGGTYRSSTVGGLSDNGQMTGSSSRFGSTGTGLGHDAWYFDGSTTRLIGLFGGANEYTISGSGGGRVRDEYTVGLNAAGQVLGFANRYSSTGTSLGRDAWFYDPVTNQATPLSFSVSASGLSSTSPEILTENGIVAGKYELYAGSADQGSRAFVWSVSAGFKDLGSLVKGGLSANQWQRLADAFSTFGQTSDGWPTYIVGNGLIADGNTGNDVFLLTAAPEPGDLLLLATTLPLALMSRRYRRRRAS